ncbi:MAG TPA: prepilin-type N-terminal cleavage/methylation domain-containing protein [Pseudolabrys sp.]
MERQPILRAGRVDGSASQDGFTLLEIVCVVAIVALLAAILLPKIPAGTSRPRLEAYAIETASLLAADRRAAIRRNVRISTDVDALARLVRSGATGRVVHVPGDVVFEAVLPKRCNSRPAFSTIGFLPSGMSCGGSITLTRSGASYEIRVNWLTGGVEIVPHAAS